MDDQDELLEDPELGLSYLTQFKILLMNMPSTKMRTSN